MKTLCQTEKNSIIAWENKKSLINAEILKNLLYKSVRIRSMEKCKWEKSQLFEYAVQVGESRGAPTLEAKSARAGGPYGSSQGNHWRIES